jgi:serine/threonine protein kinase
VGIADDRNLNRFARDVDKNKAVLDSNRVFEYIQQHLGALFEKTKETVQKQVRFSRRATQLPISFQVALPKGDEAKPEDMNVYLHFKPYEGKGVILVGIGNFKKIRLSGEFSISNPTLGSCATATPLGSKGALQSILQEIKIAQVFENSEYLMRILSTASYVGKNNFEKKVNMVMPLAEQDFEQILANGALDPVKREEWNLQLLKGLDEMYSQGIIHDDLKPANVMRRADGTIVICDFGMASFLKDHAKTMKGSPLYFSP